MSLQTYIIAAVLAMLAIGGVLVYATMYEPAVLQSAAEVAP